MRSATVIFHVLLHDFNVLLFCFFIYVDVVASCNASFWILFVQELHWVTQFSYFLRIITRSGCLLKHWWDCCQAGPNRWLLDCLISINVLVVRSIEWYEVSRFRLIDIMKIQWWVDQRRKLIGISLCHLLEIQLVLWLKLLSTSVVLFCTFGRTWVQTTREIKML